MNLSGPEKPLPFKVNKVKYIPTQHIHPELKLEMLNAFKNFYDDQEYILGSGLEKFEREYADFIGVDHAIGVGNGHDALLIAMKCLDIGHGDEVIIPAHTFIATALAVVNTGAKPVLVDVDKDSFNIDIDKIEQKVTKNTRAIIPVHIYGNPCDMDAIEYIAQIHDLYMIEDNAQAHGAIHVLEKTGSVGLINTASFYPTKNIGALGDGGIITTDSDDLAEKAKILRNYGKAVDGQYSTIGINSRLDEWQARVLSIKLKYLDQWNEERIDIASRYTSALKSMDEISLQSTMMDCINVRHIFPILTKKRDELKSFLNSKGIDTLIHNERPIHLHEAFLQLGYKKGSFPVSEKICDTELSLPIYPGLKADKVDFVCEQVKKFFLKG